MQGHGGPPRDVPAVRQRVGGVGRCGPGVGGASAAHEPPDAGDRGDRGGVLRVEGQAMRGLQQSPQAGRGAGQQREHVHGPQEGVGAGDAELLGGERVGGGRHDSRGVASEQEEGRLG